MADVMKKRTILSALEWGTAEIAGTGGASPRLDAEVLLAQLMDVERIRLYLDFDSPIGEAEAREYVARVRRRAGGEPVAYITGHKEFYSRRFAVSRAVLIPRPETECVVEAGLKALEGVESPAVLDLCSGSGNIGVTIAAQRPDAAVVCADIAPGAVEIGLANAERHGVAKRVSFLQGDLFSPLTGRLFDLVVANPPYIPRAMIPKLQVEIAAHEPAAALDGGEDGMDLIRRIVTGAPNALKPGGALLIEMAEWMGPDVRQMVERTGEFAGSSIGIDLSSRPRFVVARKR